MEERDTSRARGSDRSGRELRCDWNSPSQARRFDIHPDGDKFIMMQGAGESEAQQLFVIQNFSEELKRLVPPGN